MMNRLIGRNTIRSLVLSLNLKSTRICSRGYADGFTILLPDIPNDDATNNYMLSTPKQGELIDFKKVEPYQSFRAVLKTLFELEGCYEELTSLDFKKLLKDGLEFDQIYNEVDQKLAQLNYSYSIFQMMIMFQTSRFMLRKNGNGKLVIAYSSLRSQAYKSKTIFKIMLELNKSDKLTDEQRQVCRKYITEGKLNGLHLKTDLAVDQIKRTIESYEDDFVNHVATHSRNYTLKVSNPDYVKIAPSYLRPMCEGNSIVNLYFSPLVYDHFMSNCNDQYSRKEFWIAYNNRSSLGHCSRKVSNNILVDDILIMRRKLASHLGFINYIEYSLQSRTLESIMAIKDLIEKLFEQSRDVYKQDLEQIVRFAASQPDFKSKFLNLWDLPYFTTQIRNRTLQPVTQDLNHYFPVEKVLDGIFEFLSNNLNVKVEKVQDNNLSNSQSVLGDTLEYYRVYHNDKFVGNFFLNLYSKTKQGQIRYLTDRCDQINMTPILGIFLNYSKPIEGQKLTLSYLEVASLFKNFGKVVDHLLPKNGYAEISGINSINNDFKNLTSNLFELSIFHDYEVVKSFSQHISTGEPLPKEKHKQFCDAFCKFRSINLTEEIYRSALDFAFYTQNDAWVDTNRDVFNKYMSPFKFGDDYNHVCSDLNLLLGSNPGSYYSQLYCQVLANDLFMMTQDNQGNNQSRSDFFNAYLNNFLLNSKGTHDLDAFKKLRGRDFSIKPFLALNQFASSQQQSAVKANS